MERTVTDGRRMVSVGCDQRVRIWDLATRSILSTLPVEGYLGDADVSADGRLVAVVSNSGPKKGVAQVWDLEKRERLCELVQEFNWTTCIRFSPDGTRVVTSGDRTYGVLWDLSTGKELRRFDTGDANGAPRFAFLPDGRLLALGTVGRVRLFDVESGNVLDDIRLPNNRFIWDVTFSPDGGTLVTGQNGGHIALIDVGSSRVMKTLQDSDESVVRVKFLNDDRYLLAGSFNGPLQVWDIEREKVVAKATTGKGTNHRAAISPDGRYAATAGGESWDNETNKFKANGDYALRLWQLPESVWPKGSPAPSSSAETTEQPATANDP